MREFRILIDSAGTATAISVLKGLKIQNEYKVTTITVDMSEFVAGKFLSDKFVTVPKADTQIYIESLLEICKKEAIDLLIPIMDASFINLATYKDKFKYINTHVLIAPLKTIKITSDKYKTFRFFKFENIPTPKTYKISDSFNNINFPLIIKPRVGGVASRNVYIINNKTDFDYFTAKFPNSIIQEYIYGIEFTADCLSSIDGNDFIDCVVRKRIETKGGLAVKSNVLDKQTSDMIKKYILEISSKLKIPGAFNIQGFIKDNGDISIFEINPRFAGTHAFTIAVGLNSIKFILDMLSGESVESIKEKIKINYNMKMIRYWEEIFIEGEIFFNLWNLWKN